ncbi:MAG: permease [Paracoccaceae bacterium]|nr:permease [Paracoccaceae bacterium]
MNILIGTVVLAVLALWVWQKLETEANRSEAYAGVWRMTRMNLPRLVIALISAGLFAELLPEDTVRRYLGDTSGFQGVLLGSVLGVLTPGGAFVSFALAAGAMNAGATMPAMVAYLTSWALFAVTKVITEELAFLGPKFILKRVMVSWPIPLIAGGTALAFT